MQSPSTVWCEAMWSHLKLKCPALHDNTHKCHCNLPSDTPHGPIVFGRKSQQWAKLQTGRRRVWLWDVVLPQSRAVKRNGLTAGDLLIGNFNGRLLIARPAPLLHPRCLPPHSYQQQNDHHCRGDEDEDGEKGHRGQHGTKTCRKHQGRAGASGASDYRRNKRIIQSIKL